MRRMKEIEEYEMSNMRRIPLTKKYKKYMKDMEKKQRELVGGDLSDLTSFTREKSRVKSVSGDLNLAAQKLRQSVISAEKRVNPELAYLNKNKRRKLKEKEGRESFKEGFKDKERGRREYSGSGDRVDMEEVNEMRRKHREAKEARREKYEEKNVRVYKPVESVEGKRGELGSLTIF